jgi:hypothetical protein
MKRRKLVTRALPAVLLLATLLASAPAVQACGLENPSSVNVGLLNLAYPNALHVRTAIWIAQRDGLLAPFEAAPMIDPQSPDVVLRQMALLREIRGQFVALKAGMDASGAREVPSFSVVLLGIVLWTRFEAGDTGLNMTVHAPGPGGDDVVIVTDAPVIAALADGRLTPAEARRRGLMRTYGTVQGVQGVERFLDGAAFVKSAGAERFVATATDRMQTD